jgi:hypothetical protein
MRTLGQRQMNIRPDATLDHVVIDFTKRTVEMHGTDGEYKTISCEWNEEGLQEFENMVNFCQETLPAEQRIYKL